MNWLRAIGDIAPTLATAVATTVGGPVAGMAVGKLCEVFGLDSTDPEEALQEQILQATKAMTGEQALALKKADKDFLAQMKKLDIDVFKLETVDKQNARSMYKIAGMENKLPQMLFGGLILTGSFTLFGSVLAGCVPITVDSVLLGTIIGCCISELKQLSGFYFGSSADKIGGKK